MSETTDPDVIVMDPEELVLMLRENRSPGYGYLMLAAADRLEKLQSGVLCLKLIEKEAELTRLRAIVQRVKDEWGPTTIPVDDHPDPRTFLLCPMCSQDDTSNDEYKIDHKTTCLYDAADKALNPNRETQ